MFKYYTVVTDAGVAALRGAVQERSFSLTKAVVGDGDGKAIIPNNGMKSLVNQVWIGDISGVKADLSDPNTLIFEFAIPADTGDFTIREVGLLDSEGQLFCVGNFPETVKPVAEEGSVRDLVVRLPLHFENADVVNLVVNAAVALATKQDLLDHNDDPQAHRVATTTQTGFVRLATDEEHVAHQSGVTAVTPKGMWKFVEALKCDAFDLASSLRLATSQAVRTTYDAATRQASEGQKGQAEVATQTEVDAGIDDARFVTPNKLLSLLTRNYLGLKGGTLTGHLNFISGKWLSFENGAHWLTNNDGLGNFNLRVGHDPAEKYTSSGGAVHMEFSHEDADPSVNIHMTSKGTDNVEGSPVSFSENYSFGKGGNFAFNGNRFFGKHFKPTWTDVTHKPTVSDSVTINSSSSLASSKAVKVVNDSLNAHKNSSAVHIPSGGSTGEVLVNAGGRGKWTKLTMLPAGHIYGVAFPPNELPEHHYVANGEGLLKTSQAGKTLMAMSAAYKAAHRVTENATHVFLPNLFDENGDGYFSRFVDGVTRTVGSVQGDAIRNISGRLSIRGLSTPNYMLIDPSTNGAVQAEDHSTAGLSGWGTILGCDSINSGQRVVFDASKVVPTAHENRPKNYGVTPAIYLPPLEA